MLSAPRRLLRFEGDVVGAGMHELEFEGAGQSLVKGVRRLEAAGMRFSGIEFGGGTEFFHTHRAYGQFLSGDFCQQVEAIASGHAHPVGEMRGGDVLAKHFAYVRHKLVHVVVGLVDVVEHVVAFGHIVDHELYEGHDVAHVGHRLAVLAFPHHQEFSGRDLAQQIVDVSAVALAENHRGADYVDVPVGMALMPSLKHLLGLPFRFAVVVERIGRVGLVGIVLVQTVDRHRREENDAAASVLFHGAECHLHAAHVGVVIERHGRHVVAVLRRQEHHHVGSGEFTVHLLLLAHIAYGGDVVEKMAWLQVDVPALIFLRLLAQEAKKPCANESAGTYHCYLHNK